MALDQARNRSKRQNTGASSSSDPNPASTRTAQAATSAAAVVQAPPESTPVIPPPPTRPRLFEDNDNASSARSSAPAKAASSYEGHDVSRQTKGNWRSQTSTESQPQAVLSGYRRDQSPWDLLQDRPSPARTAPASQPYYHASSRPQQADQPPDQWHGRNTDDQTAEQSLWRGHQGWDSWTQSSWQNGYQ